MNTAQMLLAALAPTIITIDVEGFGPQRIKQLTVSENDAVRASVGKESASSEFGLRLLVASVIDGQGVAMFTEEMIPQLRASSGTKIDTLIKSVLEVNGFKGTDEKN